MERPRNGVLLQRVIHEAHRGPGYIERLRELGERIAQQFPEVKISADQPYRLTDLAIDYAEQVPRARDDVVEAIVALKRLPATRTAVSSIHIHSYFPANEKSDGVFPLMQQAFGLDRGPGRHARAAFIGDSPNDASLFASNSAVGGRGQRAQQPWQIATPPALCASMSVVPVLWSSQLADRVARLMPATVPASRR